MSKEAFSKMSKKQLLEIPEGDIFNDFFPQETKVSHQAHPKGRLPVVGGIAGGIAIVASIAAPAIGAEAYASTPKESLVIGTAMVEEAATETIHQRQQKRK